MTITLIHNILSGNFSTNRRAPETRSPLVSQVNLEVDISVYVFPVFFLFIDTMGTFTFPRTKTAKSVGHFLKTPFPVSAHELRQVCLQRSLASAPLPGMCLYSSGNKNDTGHKADRVDRLKASRPFHEDQWPFYHKRPVRCGFFFFIVSDQAQVGLWLTRCQCLACCLISTCPSVIPHFSAFSVRWISSLITQQKLKANINM